MGAQPASIPSRLADYSTTRLPDYSTMHIALSGFAPSTRDLWKTLPEDVEIWTLNWAWKYGFTRIDRLFELHDPYALANAAALGEETETQHLEWLKQEHTFPIYTLHPAPWPNAVPYPLQPVLENLFPNHPPYLTSSFAYMLALAIHEKVERIYIYGFEMANQTEYLYQKPGAEYLIGLAQGRGIEIMLPPKTSLLSQPLYGLGGQAIGRQTIEHAIQSYTTNREKTQAEIYALNGAINALKQLLKIIDGEN